MKENAFPGSKSSGGQRFVRHFSDLVQGLHEWKNVLNVVEIIKLNIDILQRLNKELILHGAQWGLHKKQNNYLQHAKNIIMSKTIFTQTSSYVECFINQKEKYASQKNIEF